DGTGYPNGLKGDEIGLYGSMAAIADTFDALTSVRPYAEPLSPSSALSYLYKERGTGFHADLVEQFIQCVGVFPVGSVVELNSGRPASSLRRTWCGASSRASWWCSTARATRSVRT